MRQLIALLAGSLGSGLLFQGPACADTELWNWTELRLPLTAAAPLTGQPVAWRAFSDVRFGTRYPGMGWNFFRTGPLWTLAPWLVVGTQGTVIAVQAEPGRFLQEYRAELEPTLLWRWGDVSFSDRNRLEYRMRFGAASTAHFRYRNQLRAAWAPTGSRWQPFVWNEPMIELNGEGLAQNRAEAGIGYVLSPDARVDVGLMMRSRAGQGPWEHDVIINTYLFYAPQVRPVLDGP